MLRGHIFYHKNYCLITLMICSLNWRSTFPPTECADMLPFSTVNRYPEIGPYVTTYICNKCGRIEENVLGPILALLLEMRVLISSNTATN